MVPQIVHSHSHKIKLLSHKNKIIQHIFSFFLVLDDTMLQPNRDGQFQSSIDPNAGIPIMVNG